MGGGVLHAVASLQQLFSFGKAAGLNVLGGGCLKVGGKIPVQRTVRDKEISA